MGNIDYSTLNDASKEAIDWAQVDLKKHLKSNTFDLAMTVDWLRSTPLNLLKENPQNIIAE